MNPLPFRESLLRHQAAFDLALSDAQIDRLAEYYSLVLEHNPLLHLVGPCSAEEFATRHILESLTILEYLPQNSRFADVGAGGGLPSIPCLLMRDDLKAILIESKEKKARFLASACEHLGLTERVLVVGKQFAEADISGCEAVTCRALDRFIDKLPQLVRWSKGRKLLLFGGDNLPAALQKERVRYDKILMPLSERRYLYVGDPRSAT